MAKKTQLQKGTIRQLQKYIDTKIKSRGFDDESLHERLLLLVEEIGELAKACRKISGMNVDTKKKNFSTVGEELTDCINMLFAVGIKLGLDIEKEFLEKEKIVDKRFYRRAAHKNIAAK
jgi:NTP pyrophosphatase (non-canonical NTP hydrolase)